MADWNFVRRWGLARREIAAAPRAAVQIKPSAAGPVVCERDVPPAPRLEPRRLGIVRLRITAEPQVGVQRPIAAAVRRAQDQLIVVVGDVLLVQQKRFRVGFVQLLFRPDPHLDRKRAAWTERRMGWHQRPVAFVLDRPAGKTLQATTKAAFGGDPRILQRGVMPASRRIGGFRAGIELPQADHMRPGRVLARILCVPGNQRNWTYPLFGSPLFGSLSEQANHQLETGGRQGVG